MQLLYFDVQETWLVKLKLYPEEISLLLHGPYIKGNAIIETNSTILSSKCMQQLCPRTTKIRVHHT